MTPDTHISIDKFNDKLEQYVRTMQNNCYLFEVFKCCGYSEIVPVYKKATCADLYKNIVYQLQLDSPMTIYLTAIDSSGNVIRENFSLQNNSQSVKDFISENNFTPMYPLPVGVVYKLMYECETTTCGCSK